MPRRSTSPLVHAVAIAAVLVACRDSSTTAGQTNENAMPLAFEREAVEFNFSSPNSFIPLDTSTACTVGGGLEQILLPPGFVATVVASEPAFGDNADMHTVNETGWDAGRFLYRTHETTTNASVSVTDLETGETHTLAKRADWERFDGIVWTPWGTILASEETAPAAAPDPAVPGGLNGFVYEIDPKTGTPTVRPAIGSKSHEGMRFDAQGNLYTISERSPGYVYRFTPDRRGDLSSGQLSVMKLMEDLGDRTGWGVWVPLDRTQVRLNADAAADSAAATGYNRPEDVETGTSTGSDQRGNRMLYVAVTGEDRVLAIDLDAGHGARRGQVLVTDYVRDGLNAPADFDFPDNLALDKEGNLFITEDPGGTAPAKKRGDDVWFAAFNRSTPGRSGTVSRFFSITDCNAEPTGIYFSKSGRSLFVDIQHRGGDGRDASMAIQRIAKVDFQVANGAAAQ
jgi:hypothetical protein